MMQRPTNWSVWLHCTDMLQDTNRTPVMFLLLRHSFLILSNQFGQMANRENALWKYFFQETPPCTDVVLTSQA